MSEVSELRKETKRTNTVLVMGSLVTVLGLLIAWNLLTLLGIRDSIESQIAQQQGLTRCALTETLRAIARHDKSLAQIEFPDTRGINCNRFLTSPLTREEIDSPGSTPNGPTERTGEGGSPNGTGEGSPSPRPSPEDSPTTPPNDDPPPEPEPTTEPQPTPTEEPSICIPLPGVPCLPNPLMAVGSIIGPFIIVGALVLFLGRRKR